ncbi:MAG: FAD-dependent oxidoreductase [Pseudomonadota bacterium]
MKIAIIGSGISGLGAAWALRDKADITVFEQRSRPGGHAHTMNIEHTGERIAVDVGFIVYNALNYPNLVGLFDALNVQTQSADMSFGISDPDAFEWASTARGLFAWKRNLARPRFHRLLKDILRFNDIARAELAAGDIGSETLGVWLDRHGFSEDFRQGYILPMGAAIWSTPEDKMLEYPALSFFRFFDNHRLMHKERPKWRTVAGGSRNYVSKIQQALGDRLRLGAGATQIGRASEGVFVQYQGGAEIFDHVILACHSDQSKALLDHTFAERRFLLGGVRYRPNRAYLHRDPALMPRRRSAWAAWNVLKRDQEDVCLSYWMNTLQSLPRERDVFVTLNPPEPPAEDMTFASFEFDHPQFDAPAEAAVRALKSDNGEDGLWLAGAWMGSGFHEDGLKSGLSAALSLGGEVPWAPAGVDIKSVPAVSPARSKAFVGERA